MISLYEHQKEALEKTKNFDSVGYFLDMGLGKTFVGSEKLNEIGNWCNLVVCQKSKIDDWVSHFEDNYNFCVFDLTSKKEMFEFLKFDKPKIGVINYELIFRRDNLKKLKDFTLLLDESSQIKNEKAKRSKFILKLNSKNNILLSGSPVAGKYEEIYSQARLLGWNISKNTFYNNYCITKNVDYGIGFPIKKVVGYKNVDRLKEKLRDHGALFMKTSEVMDLPEQVDNVVHVCNTPKYREFVKNRIVEIEADKLVGNVSLSRLLYQRKLASEYNYYKLEAFTDLINSTSDRLIVFYNFNKELYKLKAICKESHKSISLVNGDIKDLKAYENDRNSVTLIQYQAGAMGLNLQKANKIIYFSLPLSSELMEQSKKRTHRMGQDKTCFYYYLITRNSIDEKIYKVLKERRDFTNKLFEEEEENE